MKNSYLPGHFGWIFFLIFHWIFSANLFTNFSIWKWRTLCSFSWKFYESYPKLVIFFLFKWSNTKYIKYLCLFISKSEFQWIFNEKSEKNSHSGNEDCSIHFYGKFCELFSKLATFFVIKCCNVNDEMRLDFSKEINLYDIPE